MERWLVSDKGEPAQQPADEPPFHALALLDERESGLLRSAGVPGADSLVLSLLPPVTFHSRESRLSNRLERATNEAGQSSPGERERLIELADARLDKGKDRQRFREEMERFEERASQQGLSADAVKETYGQLARLLEVDGDQFLSRKARIMVAEQAIRLLADPTGVDSGYHKTCNVTAVEARMYTRYPAAAVRLLADIATNGRYVSADGSVIVPTAASLKPDDEAGFKSVRPGERPYASQIFQVTAVNVFWQRQSRDPAGNAVARGSIKYEQLGVRMKPDTGERLMDYSQGKPVEARDRRGNVLRQPYMRTNDVVEVSNQISGMLETDVLLENDYKPDNGLLTKTFRSEAELANLLVQMKKNNRLPVILTVHTGNQPFRSDSRSSTSSGGVWHVLSVTDIDESTGRVSVDNQWGRGADHLGKKAVPVADLYKATLEPGARHEGVLRPRNPLDKVVVGEER